MRNIRSYLSTLSMEELATKYVLLMPPGDLTVSQHSQIPGKLYTAFDLRQEMQRRVGPEQTDKYIEKASEILAIMGG